MDLRVEVIFVLTFLYWNYLVKCAKLYKLIEVDK